MHGCTTTRPCPHELSRALPCMGAPPQGPVPMSYAGPCLPLPVQLHVISGVHISVGCSWVLHLPCSTRWPALLLRPLQIPEGLQSAQYTLHVGLSRRKHLRRDCSSHGHPQFICTHAGHTCSLALGCPTSPSGSQKQRATLYHHCTTVAMCGIAARKQPQEYAVGASW